MTKVICCGCSVQFLTFAHVINMNKSLFDNRDAHVYAIAMEQAAESIENDYWWTKNRKDGLCSDQLLTGSKCPQCEQGCLEYDGLFVLGCPECGYVVSSGAFT